MLMCPMICFQELSFLLHMFQTLTKFILTEFFFLLYFAISEYFYVYKYTHNFTCVFMVRLCGILPDFLNFYIPST